MRALTQPHGGVPRIGRGGARARRAGGAGRAFQAGLHHAAAPLPRRRGGALLAGAEALEDTSREVLGELRRLDDAREVPLELREAMGVLARTLEGLGSPEAIPEATMADDAMASMERGD